MHSRGGPRPLKGVRRDSYSNNRVQWVDIRKLALQRDGFQCRWRFGCLCKENLEVHHIRPLGQGGLTVLSNLITLCKHHHDLKHHH